MVDLAQINERGFAQTRALFSESEIRHFIGLLEADSNSETGRLRGGKRDVLDASPGLRYLSEHAAILPIVSSVLGDDAFAVRATLFDKSADANWKVPWHQDVTIAVCERRDTEGYGPWSTKNGVVHVQPPSDVLERMITVRVHLDDCGASNGALRVMPGTHTLGRLNQNDVSAYVDEAEAIWCEAVAGEALVMRPLLLHASSAAALPTHRRVLHFDYAVGELANGLVWRMRAEADVSTDGCRNRNHGHGLWS